ncbi:PAS domain S-box protein [Rhodoferax aquaticus]|uniref:Virulence sensor protein BvgS n=1 Tax=Rhodoferax aquaticus TaxID=2527691 RepID=A0A515ER64_9BURK|nr:PAS domain S-box protein [Rhodoferax aquaticus]QDL55135.1 PAS domain S-box protein [Rhodoferax aquaticus]
MRIVRLSVCLCLLVPWCAVAQSLEGSRAWGDAEVTALWFGLVPVLIVSLGIGLHWFWAKYTQRLSTLTQFGAFPLWLACLVLAIGLGLTYAQVQRMQTLLYTDAWLRFQQQTERIESDIQTRFEKVLFLLRGLRGALLVHPQMSRADLRDWIQSRDLDAEIPGAVGISIVDKVLRSDLSAYVQKQRKDQMPSFTVRTVGEAAELFVVRAIEPLERNRAALGYDVGSELTRRSAAQRAMLEGTAALTGRITLLQDRLQTSGFIYFLPVYNEPTIPASPQARRKALRTWVNAPIVLSDLLAPTRELAQGLTGFQLFDDTAISSSRLVYDSQHDDGMSGVVDVDQSARAAMFATDRPILIGGQVFVFRAYTSEAFERGVDLSQLSRLAIAGSLLSLAMSVVTWLLLVGRARSHALARNMTQDLARLSLVAQRTSSAVLFTDAQQRIVWVNAGFTRLTGYSFEEALGQHPRFLLHSAQESAEVRASIEKALNDGLDAKELLLNRAKDGHDYWVNVEIQTLRDPSGAISGYMAIHTNVTEQIEASEALAQEKQRADRILEGTNVGTWELNCQTGESRVNERWSGMLGFALEHVAHDTSGFWARHVHPDDLVRSNNALNNCISGSQDDYACELRIQHKNGQWLWVLSRGKVLSRLPDGKAEWIAGIHMDISESKKTEAALRDMESFLDRAGRSAGLGAWQSDMHFDEIVWSAHTCDIHGQEPGYRPTLDQMLSYYPLDAKNQLRNAMDQSVNTGVGWDLTLPFTSAQGTEKWVRMVGEVEFDDSGPVRWVGAFQDVTQAQQARLDAERSESLLRGAIDVINEAFVLYDPQDRLVFCNEKYRRLYSQSADLIVPGATFESIVRGGAERGQYPAALGDIDAWVAERVAIHRAGDTELEQRLDDGRWVRVVERRMADGHIVGFRVDMTALKNSTEQAQEASARLADTAAALQSVLDSAVNVAIFATDLDRIVTVFNQGAQRMLGYNPEELIGVTGLRDLVDTGQLSQVNQALRATLGRQPLTAELFDYVCQTAEQTPWTLVRKDGSKFLSSLTVSPMVNGAGVQVGYLGIAYDMSRQKEHEASLQLAMAQAQESSIAKSQFLANMSHEIRTPMNAILGMLKLLSATALSERQRDYTAKTEGAARSLLGLLNDILDFSKVEAGKMQLELHSFELNHLMADLSVILSANLGAKNVDIVFEIDPRIPSSLVGDALRLKQILINLAGNAVKFTEQGQVLIAWRLVAQKDAQVVIDVSVSDSGIGIAPENQARIFEGFSQAEASTTRRFGGTGLGLAICTRLVGLMGGKLSLQSTLGEGSTFSFQIELAIPPSDLAHALMVDTEPASPTNARPPRRHVLLVDDNLVVLRACTAAMQALGWEVAHASTGEAGVEALRAALAQARGADDSVFDAIFVDWQMPELDGWQTLRRMRREYGQRPLPKFVMLSGQGRELLAQRSQREQELIDAFLVKPLTGTMFAGVFASATGGVIANPYEVAGAGEALPLAGLRLLVVEDNLINQQVAQELLAAQGAAVSLAGNGRLGVDAIASAQPMFDLVLMDLQMPEMDGLSAARYIRNELQMADLPIIAMTANAMSSDREACLAAGMNDHVGKPFDLTDLVATVLRYSRRRPDTGPAHTVAGGSTSSSAHDEVAAIDWPEGFDGLRAVQRMGGKLSLYSRTLQAFWQDAQTLGTRLEVAYLAGDGGAVQREAHAFKGLARTVGLPALADGAAQLETLAKQGEVDSQLREAANQLVAQVSQHAPMIGRVLAKLQQLLASQEALSRPGPSDADLQQLYQALQDDDMAAMELHAQMRQASDATLDARMMVLDTAMADLDFPAAAAACKLLLDELRT